MVRRVFKCIITEAVRYYRGVLLSLSIEVRQRLNLSLDEHLGQVVDIFLFLLDSVAYEKDIDQLKCIFEKPSFSYLSIKLSKTLL